MKCQECDAKVKSLKDDPRDPPLDSEPCLCNDCYRIAAEDIIEELQNRIAELKASLVVGRV